MDTTKLGSLESARGTLIFDQVALLQEGGGGVNDVGAHLNEGWVIFLIINANAVQHWILEHTNISVRII